MMGAQSSPSQLTSPFVVRGRDRAWRVLAGTVDLFLVDLQDGEPHGARRHVRRAEAGEILFGMPLAESAAAGVLAVALPGSAITEITPNEAGLEALESWIDALSQAIGHHSSPNATLLVEPGMEATVEDKPQAVRARGKLCWVFHRAGESAFLGNPDLVPLASPGDRKSVV